MITTIADLIAALFGATSLILLLVSLVYSVHPRQPYFFNRWRFHRERIRADHEERKAEKEESERQRQLQSQS